MIYCPYRKNNYFQYLKICSTYNSNISFTIPKEISKKKKKKKNFLYLFHSIALSNFRDYIYTIRERFK